MSLLQGFDAYREQQMSRSILEESFGDKLAVWHLHGPRVVRARMGDRSTYELTLLPEDGEPMALHKTQIKFVHDLEHAEAVEQRVKVDSEVRDRKLEPILKAGDRSIVKNKTLYVLIRERTVVWCTLLEGDVLRGLIADFTRYEMIMHLKGGVPVLVLRHAILDLHDKQGRCQLKSTQDRVKDWKKSELYRPPT